MKSISQNILLVFFVFGVFGVDAEEVKTVSVMEGDSVTLIPNLIDIKKYWQIHWRFRVELIAEIDGGKISYKDGTGGRFRDRLQLDSKTASLNITNMRMKHSGLYKLEALSSNSSIETKNKKFSVTVYESPSVIDASKAEKKKSPVSEKEGGSVILQTDVTELHGDELIVWRFGDEGKLIAKRDLEAKSLKLSSDERFRGRLKLDEKTGSLTIKKSRTNDSELYTVKISSNKQTLYKRFTVIVSAVPSSGGIIGIVVAVAVVAAAVAAVMCIRYKRPEREKQLDSIKPETVECKEGGYAVLQSYHEMKKGDQMFWRRVYVKESAVASMSENDKKTYWYHLRFRGRLQLDPQTGSLIIKYLRKTDAGVYFLEIKSTRGTSYRKYKVTLSGEVETVSVKEGDDVTLVFPGRNEHNSKWAFEEKRGFIATLIIKDNPKGNEPRYPDENSVGRFKDKLELDPKTGSLTIKNIRPEHTGLYTVMTNPRYTLTKSFNVVFDDFTETSGTESVITGFIGRIQEFCGLARIGGVFGDEKDEMKTLSVKGGDDLKLDTETEIQTDDEIIVRFGTAYREIRPYVTIARFSKPDDARFSKPDDARFSKPGDEFKSGERGFIDGLKLDLTGPLTITITSLKTIDYGDYYVQITNKKNKSFKYFTFIVVPSGDDESVSVSVMKGESIYLESLITVFPEEDQVLWTFGPYDMIIANTTTTTTDRCDNRFIGRVELEKTGSLTIKNSTTADTGMYYLHITSRHIVRNQIFSVTVNEDDASTHVKMSDDNESDEEDSSALRKFLDDIDDLAA